MIEEVDAWPWQKKLFYAECMAATDPDHEAEHPDVDVESMMEDAPDPSKFR